MNEIIMKEIPDFPDYKAGSDGHIYSLKRQKILKLRGRLQGNKKYLFVSLMRDGKVHQERVHRLICLAFNGKTKEKMDASHLNGNSLDNRPENLIWESRSLNCHRKKEHKTDDIGIKNSRALFNLEQLKQIRKWILEGVKLVEIAKRMNCNEKAIGKIKRGERYTGQGF